MGDKLQEDAPCYITEEIEYLLLKEGDFYAQKSISSSNSSIVLAGEALQNVPGAWMYSRYTTYQINLLRGLNFMGYAFELAGYIVGECLMKFKVYESSDTPFNVDPYFGAVLWGLIVLLGGCLIPVLLESNSNVVSLLSDKIRYYNFPVYILLAIYLVSKSYFKMLVPMIFNVVCLVIVTSLVFFIYSRVKYEDDGRYYVSWLEYFGIHVQFSILTAWILVESCGYTILLIVIASGESNKDANFLGWPNENWTLVIMSVAFVLGVIMLSKFKDIYFALVLCYTSFGIYSMQKRYSCDGGDNCSSKVQVCSLVYAGLLLGFSILTALFYPKVIFYSVRNSKRKEKQETFNVT